MKKILFILEIILIFVSSLTSLAQKLPLKNLIDPMSDITPMDVASGSELNKQKRKSTGGSSVAAAKRFADEQHLVLHSQSLDRTDDIQSVEQGKWPNYVQTDPITTSCTINANASAG